MAIAVKGVKPIVTSNLGPLADLFADDVGERVPPGDGPALAAAVERLVSNPQALREKGAKAQMVVRERFTARDMARREFGGAGRQFHEAVRAEQGHEIP